jgi:phage terminase large subunit-like protein
LPGYENTFKRLLLNIWTEQNTRWIPMEAWDKCNEPLPDLTKHTCYAGLDLATTTDIAALVLAFPLGSTVHLLPFFFVPEEGIRRRSERDGVPYEDGLGKAI